MNKCVDCEHNKICKHSEKYYELSRQIKEMKNNAEYNDFDIDLKCKHYKCQQFGIEGGSSITSVTDGAYGYR